MFVSRCRHGGAAGMVVVRKIPESTTLNLDNLSRQVALSQNWPVIRLPTSTMATVACGSVYDIVHSCHLLPPLNHLFAYPALILVSNWAAACLARASNEEPLPSPKHEASEEVIVFGCLLVQVPLVVLLCLNGTPGQRRWTMNSLWTPAPSLKMTRAELQQGCECQRIRPVTVPPSSRLEPCRASSMFCIWSSFRTPASIPPDPASGSRHPSWGPSHKLPYLWLSPGGPS